MASGGVELRLLLFQKDLPSPSIKPLLKSGFIYYK
jgi:hypothetical protein